MLLRDKDVGLAEKKIQEAMQMIEKSGQRPKQEFYFFLGQAMEMQKKFKKALTNYKLCLEQDQNHFGACIYMANLLSNLSEGQRAIKYFRHALKIDPDSINANFGIGKTFMQFVKIESKSRVFAENHFKKVLKLNPNHYKSLTYLGILYSDKEEFGESGTYFKRALQLKPDYPLALLSMGNLLFETDHPVNAMKYHLAALKVNAKELQALIGMANCYYSMKNSQRAIEFYS